jgi:hypothetical protein
VGGGFEGDAAVSDLPGPAPRDQSSADRGRPVVPYPTGLRPGEREQLTKRQRWMVALFFLLPLAYLVFLVVRSMVKR